MSIDLDYIRLRDAAQYGMECEDDRIGMILQDALTDRHVLLLEVARLRAEVERERADVLAYLDYSAKFPFTYDKIAPAMIAALRELIEQGEHVGYHRRAEGK